MILQNLPVRLAQFVSLDANGINTGISHGCRPKGF